MSDYRAKKLVEDGDYLFSQRTSLMSFWQEVADNFYPERADFTSMRSLGMDFAARMTTSYPMMCRRELSELLSSMLRPSSMNWFDVTIEEQDSLDTSGRKFLDWATKTQRAAMYDRTAMFNRATKQADNDFVTFGQAIISVKNSRTNNGLLFSTWHLRDVAWREGYDGMVSEVHRKHKAPLQAIADEFGSKALHQNMQDGLKKNRFTEAEIRHCVVPSENYESSDGNNKNQKYRTKFVSIYYDPTNCHIIEERPAAYNEYVIPRWMTRSGSQYAFSPAVITALPDARLIQAMSLSLLEAGEKAGSPPMIATADAISGDVNLYAGGLTWVDKEYDERLGEAIRPLSMDFSGLSTSFQMREDVKESLYKAFYLNRMQLPQVDAKAMTAFEVGQRVQEYVRNALPLFEPVEDEYNAAICEQVFDIMLMNGGFGSVKDMPDSIKNTKIRFRFESPLRQTTERQKGQIFQQAKALIAEATALDPTAPVMIKAVDALRDTLAGIGVPTKWTNSPEEMEEIAGKAKQEANATQMLQQLGAGAEVAEKVGNAAASLQQAGQAV